MPSTHASQCGEMVFRTVYPPFPFHFPTNRPSLNCLPFLSLSLYPRMYFLLRYFFFIRRRISWGGREGKGEGRGRGEAGDGRVRAFGVKGRGGGRISYKSSLFRRVLAGVLDAWCLAHGAWRVYFRGILFRRDIYGEGDNWMGRPVE